MYPYMGYGGGRQGGNTFDEFLKGLQAGQGIGRDIGDVMKAFIHPDYNAQANAVLNTLQPPRAGLVGQGNADPQAYQQALSNPDVNYSTAPTQGGQAQLQRMLLANKIQQAMGTGRGGMTDYQRALIQSRLSQGQNSELWKQKEFDAKQGQFNQTFGATQDYRKQQMDLQRQRMLQSGQQKVGKQKPLSPDDINQAAATYMSQFGGFQPSWAKDFLTTPIGAWQKSKDGAGYYLPGKMLDPNTNQSAVIPGDVFNKFRNAYQNSALSILNRSTPLQASQADKMTQQNPNAIQFGQPPQKPVYGSASSDPDADQQYTEDEDAEAGA